MKIEHSIESPALFVCVPVMDQRSDTLVPAMQDARRDNPHLGVYLLLGHLRRSGRPCDVFDWVAHSPAVGIEDVADICAGYEAVLFSCNSLNWAAVRQLAIEVRRRNPATRLCVGGPHPTLYPAYVEASALFDAYFRGEADRYIHLVYDALTSGSTSAADIPGLWMPSIGATDVPDQIQESRLAELDWRVAYDLVPRDTFLSIPLETSRGCKWRCGFCSIPSKQNWRSYPAAVASEQLHYAATYLDTSIYSKLSIIDDTFTTDHARIMELCSALPVEPFAGRLMYDATLVDLQDTELIAALEPFTSDLLVGAEVSTYADAKKITKPATPALITRAAANLAAAGMAERAVFSFIIGFPWQSESDCMQTVAFLTNLIADFGVRVYLQWYWPMPGSAIWRALEREGRVSIDIVDTPGFYRSPEWFYSVREISPDDLTAIDARIRPIQLVLTLSRGQTAQGAHPLEYSRPDLARDGGWETKRNPFIGPMVARREDTVLSS